MSPLDNLGINPGFLLIQIIAFIVLYTLLTRFIYDPLSNVLRERRTRIAKGLEDAAAAAKARQSAEADADKIMAQARADAAKAVEEARGRGDEVAKAIEAEARAAAEKIRSDAQEEAVTARDAELSGMRDQVLNISVAVAERLLGEVLDKKKQKALVDGFFADVPAGASNLSGSVEVVSAMPLTDAEQKKASKSIGADDVSFSVDPAILGGLIVRAGDQVIDGSVRSNLSDLASRLN